MKITPYNPLRPIILGDLGRSADRDLPKLSDEEILAMQPASTQELLKMPVDQPYVAKKDWVANPNAKTDEEKVGARKVTEPEKEFYLERRQRRKHLFGYRYDKTTLIHKDNHNGEFQTGTSDLRKKIAIDTFNNTNPDLVMKRDYNQKEMSEEQKEKLKPKSLWDWLPYGFRK